MNKNVGFARSENPLKSMGLGGLSFDTLKQGAIIESKKFFGITESSGNISGYHNSKINVRSGDYFLITSVISMEGKITLNFIKSSLENIIKQKEVMKEGNAPFILWAPRGFIYRLTKRRFEYRFKIIEAGFL